MADFRPGGGVDQYAVRRRARRALRSHSTALAAAPPKALVIRSGKANGFIAGADIEEFERVKTVDDAVAIVKRGWDMFERLAAAPYPTLALIRGFCLGGGFELALACRYRVVVDEPGTRLGLPEVMLGIVPGWGGMRRLPRLAGAPAALDLLLTGRTIDARRAKKLGVADECVPPRIMVNTARGVLAAAPRAATAAAAVVADAQPAAAPAHRRAGAQAGRSPRAARALPGAVRDPRHLGQARRRRARGTALRSGLDRAPAPDADGDEPDPRIPPAGAPEGVRQGRRVQGARTCTWSAPARWAATSRRGARCAASR